jgi:bacteriocin biosynthesis cyclodehydratase domain-containing protein
MLTAAGIGLVISTGATAAGASGAAASGAGPGARAGRRGARSPAGADRAARRARPPRAQPRRPGLVILADSHRRELPSVLAEKLVPHLAVSASEAIGVVGPLVLPGRSACLRCLDLTRAERDPAWPLILAQLSAQAGTDPPGCDTVLATTVAAQAVAQALAFIDQDGQAPAVTNGTLELVLPGWQWRRRTWRPHPRCGCRYRA